MGCFIFASFTFVIGVGFGIFGRKSIGTKLKAAIKVGKQALDDVDKQV